MTQKFQPTEDQIKTVLEKYSPRQIAIAYLRASRRAKEAEVAFDLMDSVNDLTFSTLTGDIKGAERAVNDARKTMRTHKQTTSAQGK